MEQQTTDVEQYKSLRRRAVQRALTTSDVSAYVESRSSVANAALEYQRTQTAGGQTLRAQARAKVHIPITLHLGEWETDTFINDLSQGGCSLFLSRLPALETFAFDLYLDGGITVRGIAEVVASRPRGEAHHVSLRFKVMAPEGRAAIQDTVLDALVGY